jgi:hypothetical protein
MDHESEVSFGEYLREHFVPDGEPETTGNEYFNVVFSSSWDWIKALRGIIQVIIISFSYLFARLHWRKIMRVPGKPETRPGPGPSEPPVIVPIMPV